MPTLDDIHYTIGQINGKLEQLVDQLGIQDDRNVKQHTEIDRRLRQVEAKQFWLAGAGSMLSAIAAYFVKDKVG